MAGNYVNPGWVNGAAPALEKYNLDNMSNAIVRNQTDIENLERLTSNYQQNETQTQANAQDVSNLKANILIKTNLVIRESQWQADATYASEGYIISAMIPVSGVTSEYMAIVVFDPADAASGNFSPTAAATTGGVLVYAKRTPHATVPVISLACIKQTN